jgi:N utilization substance protein B
VSTPEPRRPGRPVAGARRKARKRAVDVLYEADIRGADPVTLLADRVGSPDVPPVNDYTVTLVEGVTAHRPRIDDILSEHSEGWSLPRMPAVDRAVLRLGLYELLWATDVPAAVVIDEAVELAKSLSTDDSPRFVNGVLGRIAGIADQLRAIM